MDWPLTVNLSTGQTILFNIETVEDMDGTTGKAELIEQRFFKKIDHSLVPLVMPSFINYLPKS